MMRQSPLHVGPDDLLRTLRGNGGQTFTDFVDSLVRADAARVGVRPDQVVTNIRTNIGDGGVDTIVKVPLPGVLALEAPSSWQYKATGYADISDRDVTEEMRKPAALAQISAGDLYCLCVCDDAPAEWKESRRATMLKAARTLKPDAPVPRLLCAGELADWANRFPSVVVRFFRPQLEPVLPHHAWLRNERADLPNYVVMPGRAEAVRRIGDHVDFGQSCRGVLTIAGAMGTGKSRLVVEALVDVAPLVLYVPDQDNAFAVATYLINNPNASAILVVDSCSNATRLRLAQLLRGSEERVRAIALCDSSEPAAQFDIELAALEESDLQRVLDANFPEMPSSHRRALAHLADGVPQIGARLGCAYRGDRDRFLHDSAAWSADVLQNLIRDEQNLVALQLVAMFPRVGYRGAVAHQLADVCRVFGVDAHDVLARCRRLARAPGVASVGHRYITVRPRLLVRALLRAGWARWLHDDLAGIADRLPHELRVGLAKQVAMHATAVERDALVDWARPWLQGLTPDDLVRARSIELLLALVEVRPSRVASRLTDLVCSASDEMLRAEGEALSYWSTRTHILLTLRDLLGPRATYHLAESALYRVARTEGNSEDAARHEATATAKWAASFRIYLSGSEVPFLTRLEQLCARFDEGERSIPLVVAALNLILASHASRSEGRPILAGQLRPQEWQPTTYDELDECLRGAIGLLARCLRSDAHRQAALRVLTRHGRGLLRSGMIEAVQESLQDVPLDEDGRIGVLGFARDFITYDCRSRSEGEVDDGRVPDEYVAQVSAWIAELERDDVGGRLAEIVGATHWFEDQAELLTQIRDIAAGLHADRALLQARLSWLVSSNGNASALLELGRTIARLDREVGLLTMILGAAEGASSPLFVRGYVLGLAEEPAHDGAISAALDRLEASDPLQAVDLSRMAPRSAKAGARALRLVREGRLRAEVLPRLIVPLPDDLLAEAIDVILDCPEERQEEAAAIGLDLVGHLAWLDKTAMPEDERSVKALWRLMEAAIPGARAEVQAWGRLLLRLSEREFAHAVELCCRAVMSGEFSIQEEGTRELTSFIAKDPGLCLSIYGPMLFAGDPRPFGVGRRGHALRAFPFDVMKRWIEENGLPAARVAARSLPLPFLGGDGSAHVDPLTELVLESFEDDDDVYSAFAHGRHDGQVYVGDISGQREAEGTRAAAFLTHRLRRVRQWAEEEASSARSEAQWWREHHEERFDE